MYLIPKPAWLFDGHPSGIIISRISSSTALYANQAFVDLHGWPTEVLFESRAYFESVFPDPTTRRIAYGEFYNLMQKRERRFHVPVRTLARQDGVLHVEHGVHVRIAGDIVRAPLAGRVPEGVVRPYQIRRLGGRNVGAILTAAALGADTGRG